MKRKRFSEEQIVLALRQADSGTTIEETCRKIAISEPTCSRWKKVYAGMRLSEIRRLKQFEDENAKLKRVVAALTLDEAIVFDTRVDNHHPTASGLAGDLDQNIIALLRNVDGYQNGIRWRRLSQGHGRASPKCGFDTFTLRDLRPGPDRLAA